MRAALTLIVLSGAALAACAPAPSAGGAATTTTTTTTTVTTTRAESASADFRTRAPVPTKVPTVVTRVPTVVTAKPTTTKPVPVEGGNDQLGPFGWQTLEIGTSAADAENTGMFTSTPSGSCAVWPTIDATALVSATVDGGQVVAIRPKQVPWMHTFEGLKLGLTRAQVHALYPDVPATGGSTAQAAVPGNSGVAYRMTFDGGVVSQFWIQANPGC